MKRVKKSILLTFIFLLTALSSAQALEPEVIVDIDPDGYASYGDKMKALLVNDRAMLPLRDIAEKMGYRTEWHAAEKKIVMKKGNVTVSLVIDSNEAIVNGKPISLDSPAKLIQNKTYVPVRFVSEATNHNVYFSQRAVDYGYPAEIFITFYNMVPDEEWISIYSDHHNYSYYFCEDYLYPNPCYQSLNSYGKTNRNIGIGSTVEEVRKAYGIPRHNSLDRSQSGTLSYWGPFTPQSGDLNALEFTFENGKVVELIVPYGN
ncbi:copper amine oxidase N-terminal domain-containing protein [Heliorestis acidaminivorans]|uniref:Copper amine oxidase N-terminal domain-containing protein n=1 Tax=Heliorestis acidaminivorans TaxID=553427 RepID=A0A6I0F1U5_9FIRM|nr:copper amine oxidase N-terminal domain-containing protein [Heliorestis acidaminivorans]KAB2953425.1 copper amine oxidase N-terminal domain-containing protein [Heliorestis acidaminivorans]